MKRISILASVFLMAVLAVFALPQNRAIAQDEQNVMLILDASNSMWGQIDGKNKIVIAREVIADVLGTTPGSVRMGVMAYGHRKEGDCRDIETVIPVGPVDAPRYTKVINAIKPRGKTPITAAVRQAAEELRHADVPATVILVSDGLETCNADPCAAAADLEAAGVNFTVHVVGFDIKAGEAANLSCLAEQTGGRYFDAGNASELSSALGEAVQEVAAAPEPEPDPEPAKEPEPEPEPVVEPMLKLTAIVADGADPLDDGVRWFISEGKADANGKRRRIRTVTASQAEVKLEPGKYHILATYGKVKHERIVEVRPDQVTEEVFKLNAGRLTAVGVPVEGAEPFGEMYYILYEAKKDINGKRKEFTRQGRAQADLILPAGTYWLEGRHKDTVAGQEVTIEAGALSEITLVLGTGYLQLSAIAEEGGEPLKGAYYIVYEAKKDLSGKRKEVKRSGADQPLFGLPPGDYHVEVAVDIAKAATDITVVTNERVERSIVMNLGAVQLNVAVPGAGNVPQAGIRYDVYGAKKGLDGKRKSVKATVKREPLFRMNAGDYHVVARIGTVNATAEAGFTVEAGSLTETVIEVPAGTVNLSIDGAPPQRRRWEIQDGSGKYLTASTKPQISYILAPGTYEIVLKAGDKTVSRTVTIETGTVQDIALPAPQ